MEYVCICYRDLCVMICLVLDLFGQYTTTTTTIPSSGHAEESLMQSYHGRHACKVQHNGILYGSVIGLRSAYTYRTWIQV